MYICLYIAPQCLEEANTVHVNVHNYLQRKQSSTCYPSQRPSFGHTAVTLLHVQCPQWRTGVHSGCTSLSRNRSQGHRHSQNRGRSQGRRRSLRGSSPAAAAPAAPRALAGDECARISQCGVRGAAAGVGAAAAGRTAEGGRGPARCHRRACAGADGGRPRRRPGARSPAPGYCY